MRITQQLTTTLREAPHDAESGNHELLVRAGFIRQLTAGIYSFLPLGARVIHNISKIIREEMDRAGGQEVIMPVLQPRELWEQRPAEGGASRAELYAGEFFSLEDRKGRELILGPTHEEVAHSLIADFVQSYRDLPQYIYQLQVKFRDQWRPRGGLLRTRELLMMDLYSFDANEAGLERSYQQMIEAYKAVFTRCGLRFLIVQADSGPIGGSTSHEFIAPVEAGEDTVILCRNCDYAANQERAEFVSSEQARETPLELEEVYTPNCKSISELAAFLAIQENRTLKSICYVASGKFVLAIIRGDLEINEIKLANILQREGLNAADLHLASPEELTEAGIIAGYTSPLGKDKQILIVADISLKQGNNYVAGANKAEYHIKHVNYPRDFRVDVWGDIALAYEGATCSQCGGKLYSIRSSELGHIFKPGTLYSYLFQTTFLDTDGTTRPIFMGSYGIGISRLMGIIVEQSHDDKGIIWPFSVAPYHVALIGLDLDKPETGQAAGQLYTDLLAAGIEVLFDDRTETAGVKFNDADLLGLPLRAVISKRSLKNGGVELKLRSQKESRIVPLSDTVRAIQEEIHKELAR
ncbi:proline--tRNA ligase [Ktedonosporobacter rubrisoli]|uniref:Proline--tRNA ligase n=1 Tax=Ktedonosporobacter rubrisoli TaxID=2509675 RepID=A0A4P6K135_KTERU|nr:proline--tRNA ligase [Ktedonosporobacter rubrisoli]QBD81685.1 proline--tRNA ligase [Ktedonosporobacter rubrisoli]